MFLEYVKGLSRTLTARPSECMANASIYAGIKLRIVLLNTESTISMLDGEFKRPRRICYLMVPGLEFDRIDLRSL